MKDHIRKVDTMKNIMAFLTTLGLCAALTGCGSEDSHDIQNEETTTTAFSEEKSSEIETETEIITETTTLVIESAPESKAEKETKETTTTKATTTTSEKTTTTQSQIITEPITTTPEQIFIEPTTTTQEQILTETITTTEPPTTTRQTTTSNTPPQSVVKPNISIGYFTNPGVEIQIFDSNMSDYQYRSITFTNKTTDADITYDLHPWTLSVTCHGDCDFDMNVTMYNESINDTVTLTSRVTCLSW